MIFVSNEIFFLNSCEIDRQNRSYMCVASIFTCCKVLSHKGHMKATTSNT
jgi:hypothetical protein